MADQNSKDLKVPKRILLGPGPSNVSPKVLEAISMPLIGHLDPRFLEIMNDVQQMLRQIFQTNNELTIPISGTGSSGMEAAFCNFIEPGDKVLIAVNGYFGDRMVDMASRYGAVVERIDRPWGESFSAEEIEKALKQNTYKLFAIVHGETSTGVNHPNLKQIAEKAHENGAIVILDTVTTLAGVPVKIDEWDIDVAYSGTQKAISCPPGLAPITISPRARKVLNTRKTKVANWYLDLSMVEKYWGNERTYHHTAPISMIYAFWQALKLIVDEGLENRYKRHQFHAEVLWDGLEKLGFDLLVPKEQRLSTLSTPLLPDDISDAETRKKLLNDYDIEIAGGFGPLAGKIWRIGLMGYSSKKENVDLLLSALETLN